jgi:hypothetical protein
LGGGINLFLYTSILGRNLLNNKLSLLKVAEAKLGGDLFTYAGQVGFGQKVWSKGRTRKEVAFI